METNQYRIEHFKALLEENKSLGGLIQKLWRFKFTVVAVTICISLLAQYVLDLSSSSGHSTDGISFVTIGFVVAPLLAFVIDFKMLEIAMYLKLIADYKQGKFSHIEEIQGWEKMVWDNGYTSFKRTIFSFALSVGVSILFLILSLVILGYMQPEWTRVLIYCGIGFIIIPLVALLILIPKFLR